MPKVLNKRKLKLGDRGVYIGRPSKWGNYPATELPDDAPREAKVLAYRRWLEANPWFVEQVRKELAGKDLICWCAPAMCHGDVLLEYANHLPRKGLFRFLKDKP